MAISYCQLKKKSQFKLDSRLKLKSSLTHPNCLLKEVTRPSTGIVTRVIFFGNMTPSIQLNMELPCSLKFQFWIMFNVEINSQCRFYKSDMSLENSVGGYLRLVFVSSVRTRRLNDTPVNNFWNFGFMVSHNFPLSSKIKLKNSIWPITGSHELKRLRTKLRNSRDKHLLCRDWMLISYPWKWVIWFIWSWSLTKWLQLFV